MVGGIVSCDTLIVYLGDLILRNLSERGVFGLEGIQHVALTNGVEFGRLGRICDYYTTNDHFLFVFTTMFCLVCFPCPGQVLVRPAVFCSGFDWDRCLVRCKRPVRL
jgi:hypothetical protein